MWYIKFTYMYHIHQSARHLRTVAILGLTSLLLTACNSNTDVSSHASNGAQDMFDAATGPLEDLNIKRKEIPELLQTVMQDPYARPKKLQCKTIQDELAQLDTILGPDYEAGKIKVQLASASSDELQLPELPDADTLADSGEQAVHDGVIGFISSEIKLPFRGIIRFISGADRHDKEVQQAYQAGQIRRAYLKGLAQERFGKRCLTPPAVMEARATHAT